MAKYDATDVDTAIQLSSLSCGYQQLKFEQSSIINHFVNGYDVFGCLPTGFGKSACFVMLPMIFDYLDSCSTTNGSIIKVVSPITSLMNDQVSSCTSMGISAVAVTRQNKSKQLFEDVTSGKYQVIYISPEMLIGTHTWRCTLQNNVYKNRLKAIIIDEAHCVKTW
jgi:ATP-dependent DNA helicase RecQ